mmetsp:Transcript_48085/g.35284  ORF Transcript_48085/g.35284 Transcript_48085/m.35284 type:complete len:253 (-) Transcript_48085:532-1290(-)
MIFKLVGESVLFTCNSELYHRKRRSLSAAFFKDKITNMMQVFIKLGYQQLTLWEEKEEEEWEVALGDYFSVFLNKCVLACVFGQTNVDHKLALQHTDGHFEQMEIGKYMEYMMPPFFMRFAQPLRTLFDIFDNVYIWRLERIQLGNLNRFRSLIQHLIEEKRLAINNLKPGEQGPDDFLAHLIQDDVFKDDDDMKIDECNSFMIASSGTTMRVIARLIYFSTRYEEVSRKIRQEFQDVFGEKLRERGGRRMG